MPISRSIFMETTAFCSFACIISQEPDNCLSCLDLGECFFCGNVAILLQIRYDGAVIGGQYTVV